MLKDIRQTFAIKYDEYGDSLITDNYILDEGTYIIVNSDGSIDSKNILEINKKNYDSIGGDKFVHLDYLSKLLEMNKPMDKFKTIHSNNYMSFWIKKNNIREKLNKTIIEDYYAILLNPKLKYEKSSELYQEIEKDIGRPDEAAIEKYKNWILENIFDIVEKHKLKDDKNYLKIYFYEPIENYIRENKRYIVPNIYNSSDYNIRIGEDIYGMPNDNIGLNSKKPFLDNKGRKISTPYLISTDEVILQKKMFDYLLNFANNGKTNIYVDEKEIEALESGEMIEREFKGYFIKIKKGKEVEIHDFDTITHYNPKLKNFLVNKIISSNLDKQDGDKGNLSYGSVSDIKTLSSYINSVFFNKFLTANYFTEPKKIKLRDNLLKKELILCRGAYFNWFYKGDLKSIRSIFPKSSLKIIKNTISNGFLIKAIEQFNLRDSILKYLGGETYMEQRIDKIVEELRNKINGDEICSIGCDDEYYFAMGQAAQFLISKNKAAGIKQSLINPIISSADDKVLRNRIKALYKKYNYDIDLKSKRFNNLYSMVLRYEAEKCINDDMLIAGFITSNLIYEKKEKQEGK